ncbi:glycosyltransferase [Maridesulfovibrio bastinii]|uniref:glycosyltransferase n=1 Tax=Maridesulfovibrio bastinii TaxID=47157 RepID=UPI0004021DB6|nr:glycosyltransferase [Maridesulfovibrio bastinii]
MPSTDSSCILYDFLYCMGGAEKTTLLLQESFNNSCICVDFVNKDEFESLNKKNIIELGKAGTCQPLNAIKGIRNFKKKTKFLKNCTLGIYSGSYAPCAVHNQLSGKKILYCHTIPRFAYDLYDYYLNSLSPIAKPLFRMLASYVRKNYELAFNQMDLVIANSENVRQRIRKYLNSEAQVINPPVETSSFKWISQGDYYLSTARLEKYKRVDLIVSAFKKMPDKKLIVTSGGAELNNLKKLAGNAENIHFTGWVSYPELIALTGNSIATIYIPRDEDFGISPVESMAAGKPVIGAREGGILETVKHGQTGFLIAPETEEIINAVEKLTPALALLLKNNCEEQAKLFDTANFISKMKEAVGFKNSNS